MDSKNTKANSLIKKDPRKSGFPKKMFQTDGHKDKHFELQSNHQLTYKKSCG